VAPIVVDIMRLPHAKGLPLPDYATSHASGVDLVAAIERDITIFPECHKVIPTGISVAVPEGYEIQIRPRSGLAVRHRLTVLNTPGTIDADYRGELHVLLINLSDRLFIVERGMRIAQAVLAPVMRITWQEVLILPETPRGTGGLGSTGV
jgi:dUTP pyrophosphatase